MRNAYENVPQINVLKLKPGQVITFKKPDQEEKCTATVLSRAGKATGKYSTLKFRIAVYIPLFFWKNFPVYTVLIRVCTAINFRQPREPRNEFQR